MRTLSTLILCSLMLSFAGASTVYFDLDDSFIVSGNWNTVNDWLSGVHITDAVDSSGNATSVAFNCVDGFAMYNNGGDPGVTAYPIEAGKDSFYLSAADNYAKILIGGLTAGQSYDFKFFGSRASAGPRVLNISIGAQTVSLESAYNKSNVAVISGIAAGASGIVAIEVRLASGSSYGYLGVIEINGVFSTPVPQEPGIFVAPWGLDSNPGTYSWPKATMQGAADAIKNYKLANGLPEGGLNVYFRGGHYYFTSTATFNNDQSGEADKPVTLKPYNGEQVIFDGSVQLENSNFALVTAQAELDRLGTGAAGNVYSCYISDSSLRTRLSDAFAVLDLDGQMAQVSRYPNLGNVHIKTVLDVGAVYTEGRTPGEPPVYSMDDPIGPEFTIKETNAARWQAEYQTVKKARLSGYLSNDWYKESQMIARVNAGAVKLLAYTRYETVSTGARRFYVLNLMCELDAPGEWYFDESANKLYVWPYQPINLQSNIGVWNGPEFLRIYCSNVNFEDFIIQGTTTGAAGSGMVTFFAGDNTKFSGCTFRNTSRPAVSFMTNTTSTNSGITGCDIYDVTTHLNLYGGVANASQITGAGNYAVNCHFTQVQSRDYAGVINARGVGNIFRNNLVHNFLGDAIKPGGNDNIVELNEVFNCGVETGDGGAIYWAAQMPSYGNIFRNNFLHHIMCTPGLHPRGGMYPDQLDAGDTFEQNVFYKTAHRAILLNGGAGHSVLRNVFLEGYIGIYQTESYAQQSYDDIPLYDNGTLTRGDVGDYIWRTEQIVGSGGWNNEPWLSHYPMFALVMNQEMMRFWPIENYYIDNMFCGNTGSNFQYRYTSTSTTTNIDSTPSYIHKSGNRDITMDVFENPAVMNYKFTDSAPSWAPDIPFEDMGLYIGDGRKSMPDKDLYRSMIKQHFAGRPSYDGSAVYDPATINGLIYYNTGELLMNMPEPYVPSPDLNEDGKKDLLDYSMLSNEWLKTTEPVLWYDKNFDTFTLGVLIAQQDWEAHSAINVVDTSDDGLYTGGRALKAVSYTDDWPRGTENAPLLGIDTTMTNAIKISFDVREGSNSTEGTTVFSAKMFLRQGATANYSPSFGIGAGVVTLRPAGEQGDTISGNNLASTTYYGADKYWEKGDWLRISLVLNGANFRYATVLISNLSRGGLDVPTGIANVDIGRDLGSAAMLWNRPTFRFSGSINTYADNILAGDANPTVLTADINQDGIVNIDDLDSLISLWLQI